MCAPGGGGVERHTHTLESGESFDFCRGHGQARRDRQARGEARAEHNVEHEPYVRSGWEILVAPYGNRRLQCARSSCRPAGPWSTRARKEAALDLLAPFVLVCAQEPVCGRGVGQRPGGERQSGRKRSVCAGAGQCARCLGSACAACDVGSGHRGLRVLGPAVLANGEQWCSPGSTAAY